MSGVTASDQVKKRIEETKVVRCQDRIDDRARIVILKIQDESRIEEDKVITEKELEDVGNIFQYAMDLLLDEECCYMIYDCHYETTRSKKTDLVLIMWTPEGASVRQKMIYAASKSALTKLCTGFKYRLDATDRDAISKESFIEFLKENVIKLEGHDAK